MFDPPKTDRNRPLKILSIGFLLPVSLIPLAVYLGTIPALFTAAIAAGVAIDSARRFASGRSHVTGRTRKHWPSINGTVELVNVSVTRKSARRRGRERLKRCRGKAIRVRYNPIKPELSFYDGFGSDPELDSQSRGPWLPPAFFEAYLQAQGRTAMSTIL